MTGSGGAFAAILEDGSCVTWGHPGYGGDSSRVQHRLNGASAVVELESANNAFCAILANGSVVTWGCQDHGGDSSGIEEQLQLL